MTSSKKLTKIIFFISVFSLALISTKASAAVRFNSAVTHLNAVAGHAFSIDLEALLADEGTGNLTWSADTGLPDWLAIDESVLSGNSTLSDAGIAYFKIFVRDGSEGAETQVVLNVKNSVTPNSSINLGVQTVGNTFTYDLKPSVELPNPRSLTFTSEDLPSWLDLNSIGNLSGVPTPSDVGNYQFTVTVLDTEENTRRFTVTGQVSNELQPGNPAPARWAYGVVRTADVPVYKSVGIVLTDSISNPSSLPYQISYTGPTWLTLTNGGILIGTPMPSDQGPQTATIQIASTVNGVVYYSTASLEFNVTP